MSRNCLKRVRCALVAVVSTSVACTLLNGCLAHNPGDVDLPFEHTAYIERLVSEVDIQAATLPPPVEAHPLGIDVATQGLPDERWPLTFTSAVGLALQNNTVIRQDAQFLSPSNPLLNSVDFTESAFDPAIQITNITFGNRGLNGALADFNPRLTSSMIWGRNELIQNVTAAGGVQQGNTLVDETGNFDIALEKQFYTGSSLRLSHNVDYRGSNAGTGFGGQLFPSVYTGDVSLDFIHPLWAGSGTEFTQIAGPPAFVNQRVLSVNQGVLIAKVNSEVAQLEFEQTVRQLVKEVSDVYWDLYFAHQRYQSEVTAQSNFKDILDKERADLEAGRGNTALEAQAAESFYASQARVDDAAGLLRTNETRLRRLLNLPVKDGTLIEPVDPPEMQAITPDLSLLFAEALVQRTELQRSKFALRSLQLQRKAAESLNNPRLDFIAGYRVNGFGDRLFSSGDYPTGTPGNGLKSFYDNLGQNDQTGYTLGLQLSMPLGFRQERSQVANIELRIAKTRAIIAAQEAEIAHELQTAIAQLERWQQVANSSQQRSSAADRRVEALQQEFDAGRGSLDELVRARSAAVTAQVEYQRGLSEYSKALGELHFRSGSLLARSQIGISFDGDDIPDALPTLDTVRGQSPLPGWSPSELAELATMPLDEPADDATPPTPLPTAPLSTVPSEEQP